MRKDFLAALIAIGGTPLARLRAKSGSRGKAAQVE
jgi:hypothetical protein